MEDLKKVFSEEKLSPEKSKILSDHYDRALELERESVSGYSPGIVLDYEVVARQIFSPIHYDELRDEIVAAAFDDVANKGLSVNRLSYVSKLEIHASGLAKAERDRERKPDRKYIGFCNANVGSIREIVEEDKRVFAVYDSALIDSRDHADVCQLIFTAPSGSGLSKKAANMKRRSDLQELFNEFIKIS